MKTTQSICAILCLAMLTLALGCGKGDEISGKMQEANKENIRRVRNCYAMYMDVNKYQGPKDKAELMDFLKNNPAATRRLERIGVTQEQVDTMWVSERDGEEFKIRWGLSGMADHAIVFEATGMDGKRMVCFSKPQELDEDEYEDYWTGKLQGDGPGGAADTMGEDVIDEMKREAAQ